MVLVAFGISLFVAFLSASVLIDRLKREGIFGSDIHKPRGIVDSEGIPRGEPGYPEIPEMGGLAIVVGFGAGILLAVALVSFFHVFPSVDLIVLLAVLSTVLLAGLIGIVDDLLGGCSKSNPVTTPPEGMRQWMKALP